ncbi:hypothetical protein HORM4_490030 [Vibrio harveyi]|uniref:hypothetical protein n=1 Tax=Vibrio harveyi TaxID=669 RepID=UPI002AD864DD|nr:hypothetical protein [Vibrio harveyi]CAK6714624.1 hypothetical protein HORM4_490030 [Vibrio harveyi]
MNAQKYEAFIFYKINKKKKMKKSNINTDAKALDETNREINLTRKQTCCAKKAKVVLPVAVVLVLLTLCLTWISVAPLVYFKYWLGLLNVSGSLTIMTIAGFGVFCLGYAIKQHFYNKHKYAAFLFYSLASLICSIAIIPTAGELLLKDNFQRVKIEGDTVFFNGGEVELPTALHLKWLLYKHEGKLTKAKISGPGGDTTSAYYIKYLLHSEGVKETTAYGNLCNSSCTIIWTLGEKRTIDNGIHLGFHSTCSWGMCDTKEYLYDGFLTPDLINVLASPDNDHGCPIGESEIATLEGSDVVTKEALIPRIESVCYKRGLNWDEFKNFSGYENITI